VDRTQALRLWNRLQGDLRLRVLAIRPSPVRPGEYELLLQEGMEDPPFWVTDEPRRRRQVPRRRPARPPAS
jgi:hypothetical protein